MKRPRCLRCGNPFVPFETPMGQARHCRTCAARNIYDFLELPTPPLLLDKHTKIPALTNEEWDSKIRKHE